MLDSSLPVSTGPVSVIASSHASKTLHTQLRAVWIFLVHEHMIEPFGRHVTLVFDDGTILTFEESEPCRC
jgi:hypothetical protein